MKTTSLKPLTGDFILSHTYIDGDNRPWCDLHVMVHFRLMDGLVEVTRYENSDLQYERTMTREAARKVYREHLQLGFTQSK